MSSAQDQFLQSTGLPIRFIDKGKGTPVILVHGFTGTLDTWPLTDPLLSEGFRVVALDCRGHGQSGKPHDSASYGLHMIADVIHLMDSLDIQKAHIIGYSMGAEIALRLAIEHPERVLSLGLGGSGWSGQADYENYRLMADSLDKSASFGPVLREMTPAGDKGPTDEEISAIDEMLQNQDIHALIAVARAMSEIINITEVELKNLGIPVLGISGELDPERGNLEKMTGVIPDYSMKVLIGRDHVGALSDPLYTLEHIEFLTNQER